MPATNDVTSFYFSGQGIVLLAARDGSGNPTGFTNVGNVSALAISLETTVLEHKESSTGARAIDLRLTTENKVNVSATLESVYADNLVIALRGDSTTVSAGSVTDEIVVARLGKTVSLANINVSSVVVTGPSGTPTYVDGTDYTVNPEVGSLNILSAGSIPDAGNIEVDYAFTDQIEVNSFTTGSVDRWLRFEGLNTARTNEPVVVDIFKFSADPLQELALIQEDVAQMVLEGSALADATKVTGSQFFRIRVLQ